MLIINYNDLPDLKIMTAKDVEGLNSRLDNIDTKISELEENLNSGGGGGENITLPIEITDVKDLDIKISEFQQENGILKHSLTEMQLKIQELENLIQQIQ